MPARTHTRPVEAQIPRSPNCIICPRRAGAFLQAHPKSGDPSRSRRCTPADVSHPHQPLFCLASLFWLTALPPPAPRYLIRVARLALAFFPHTHLPSTPGLSLFFNTHPSSPTSASHHVWYTSISPTAPYTPDLSLRPPFPRGKVVCVDFFGVFCPVTDWRCAGRGKGGKGLGKGGAKRHRKILRDNIRTSPLSTPLPPSQLPPFVDGAGLRRHLIFLF